ncbi:MAG: dialkylresorcinol condensing enzyme [Lautropia sp.]|nr:dialkylresorcinol condensing enzyme [Lautropia sp.]
MMGKHIVSAPQVPRKILIVQYSQTGQLARMADAFAAPLEADPGFTVERLVLRPQESFPFPWPFLRFFNTFPETVHLRPAPIETPAFAHDRYDLVVLAWTVWFLSPAQPVTAFLQHPHTRERLAGTPVVSLIGCRNMWLMAFGTLKQLLDEAGLRLIDNVVKIDACNTGWSLLTTPLWMLTGRRKAAAWMPPAGISEADIADCGRFGARAREVLRAHADRVSRAEGVSPAETSPRLDTMFRGMGAVRVNEKLILSERFAHRSFRLWGALLMAVGRISPMLRRIVLCGYILFLITIICTVLPVSALLKWLLAPVLRSRIQQQKAHFAQPSGE